MNRREPHRSPAPAARPALVIPEGPWCASTWQVIEPAGDRRRAAAPADLCSVDACDGERYWLGGPVVGTAVRRGLCYAHYFQWFRAGQPTDFTAW